MPPLLADVDILGQTFAWKDLAVVGLLVVLEGVLSIDNALVLGILAKRLPKPLQNKALTYGLVGAFVFRFVAIFLAAYLLHWRIVKVLGGAYLVYISIKHFFFEDKDDKPEVASAAVDAPDGAPTADPPTKEGKSAFWPTVAVIELTDIAFAVDSILAAIALVGSPPPGHDQDAFHPKFWVVLTGGFLGVILMRFAAALFIKLLDKFPRFETAAYLLVLVIGGKLLVDWYFNTEAHPHAADFHSPSSPAFWVFWVTMLLCFCVGFLPERKPAAT